MRVGGSRSSERRTSRTLSGSGIREVMPAAIQGAELCAIKASFPWMQRNLPVSILGVANCANK